MTSLLRKLRGSAAGAGVLLAIATPGAASLPGAPPTLVAYGPGGPHHVLQECAEAFREKHGVAVAVVKASPGELERRVREDGDLYFGGAEYMLEEFARRNPGVLDLESAEVLHARRIGVLVRKGNPLGIRGRECLRRDDVDLLSVELEDMRPFLDPARDGGVDFRRRVYTGQQGVGAWRAHRDLDAWVTYRSWHVELQQEADFIELPGDAALRHTPVALTSRTPHREAARAFIAFLKSPEGRRIFVEHGWE